MWLPIRKYNIEMKFLMLTRNAAVPIAISIVLTLNRFSLNCLSIERNASILVVELLPREVVIHAMIPYASFIR